MEDITVKELAVALKEDAPFTILDVREDYEYNFGHIDCKCIHIPMGELGERIHELDRNQKTYVVCNSGKRAAAVVNFLKVNFGFREIACIVGGMEAYVNEVDNSIKI